jgi:histidine phosphotransferase ChpT
MQLDLEIVDVLLSRLLHDLIGPVTATVNGIELVEEFGSTESAGLGREALDLIGESARQTVDRLGLFRMAFGMAGNARDSKFEQIKSLAQPYLASRRIEFACSGASVDLEESPVGIVKVTLATIFLLADALRRGGRITVEMGPDARSPVRVSAAGNGVRLDEGSISCLSGEIDGQDQTTRTVIATMVRMSAIRFGFDVALRAETEQVTIELLPVG